MNHSNMLILMAICQMVNFYIMAYHPDKELFLKKGSGRLFLILPALVILSLIWRPL